MSLPREWCLQDARGMLHRSCGATETFAQHFSKQPLDDQYQSMSSSQQIIINDEYQATVFNLSDRSTATPIKPSSEFDFMQCDEHIAVVADIALFTEYNTAGSLFSIHSAPPVPLADLGSSNVTDVASSGNSAQANGACVNGNESPRRPISLAIESQQNFSTKTIAAFPLASSEVDEDDNENLLTVSSITARPLIAKSRELRSSKLTERFNRKQEIDVNTAQLPLDGGYGWLVVFGAFSVQFWVAGLVKSYGVLFVEILEIFPSSSTAVASWIPAILSALCLALAPLSSALCQRFSCRTVVFVGGLFCALGLMLSYYATSLYHLLFTFGILTGIGGGLSTTPGIIIVSLYFNKRRALANGICVSGTAAGSFVFPMLIEYLIHKFGFHGTILILGGGMLHVCASATLYRPLEMNYHVDAKAVKNEGIDTGLSTNSTFIGTTNDEAKKYIEHLFMEESKNRQNDYYNANKLVNIGESITANDADDECADTIGETRFVKPQSTIKSTRSSTLLHSVEDLSTDSTCVYKSRTGGFDSNRGSRRRIVSHKFANGLCTDDVLDKQALNNQLERNSNRGLSKSMILPTPASDFSEFDDAIKLKKRKTLCDKIKRYIDVSLLKDPTFIGMCLSVTLMSTGCPYMLYFLPAYAISAGFTKSEAGLLVAVSAILDLIGRLGFGYLSDLQIFDRKKAYIVCILGAGVAVLTIPLAKHSYLVGCSSAAYGLCLGCWYLLMPVLLADLFGTERISSSYGLVRMFQSLGAISVPPLAGFLKDLTGGYEICFYGMGACMVLGSVPLFALAMFELDNDTPTPSTEESEASTVSN